MTDTGGDDGTKPERPNREDLNHTVNSLLPLLAVVAEHGDSQHLVAVLMVVLALRAAAEFSDRDRS